ncbi:helix-turn-helix transcriptional regulator [Methyloversatilis discipulorum]|uniref:helix-turn-helix transcriptional regulator n=1 Tax=Methyloversatilis discipulorum TaxID=1119528 RepID=UPI003F2A1173
MQIQLLTKAEMAAQLRISERQVELMVRAKRLPHGVRMGKQVFWDAAVVDAYCQSLFAHQTKWLAAREARGRSSLPAPKESNALP